MAVTHKVVVKMTETARLELRDLVEKLDHDKPWPAYAIFCRRGGPLLLAATGHPG